MDIGTIAARQEEFDRQHGWSTDSPSAESLIAGLQQDIVGLVGELGEFANIVQKVQRNRASNSELAPDLALQRPALAEELADTFVYLLRLVNRLGIDLEEEYERKLAKNEQRFAEFRQ